jgi:hypothetical protein
MHEPGIPMCAGRITQQYSISSGEEEVCFGVEVVTGTLGNDV